MENSFSTHCRSSYFTYTSHVDCSGLYHPQVPIPQFNSICCQSDRNLIGSFSSFESPNRILTEFESHESSPKTTLHSGPNLASLILSLFSLLNSVLAVSQPAAHRLSLSTSWRHWLSFLSDTVHLSLLVTYCSHASGT